MEERPHRLRRLGPEPLHARELLQARLLDAPERPERAQERLAPSGADAGDLLQDGLEVAGAAQLAVEGDGEAVRLVPQAGEEEELGRVLAQHDGILAPGQEDALGGALGLGHEAPLRQVGHVHQLGRLPRVLRGGSGASRGAPPPPRDHARRAEVDEPALGQADHLHERRPLVARDPLRRDAEVVRRGQRRVELPLAAVDDEQVREAAFGQRALEPARDDLVQHGEVVLAGDALHLVAAVAGLVRLAVLHGDARADRQRALERGDVVALHPARLPGQVERARQGRQRLVAPLVLLVPALEALGGVPGRHLEQVGLRAALGREELHLPSAPIREHLGERPGSLDLERQEHLLRSRVLLVVEGEERGERLLGGELLVAERIGPRVLQLATAHGEDRHHQLRALAVEPEHVAIGLVGHEDALLLQAALHRHQLIADARGVLEALGAGGLLHAPAEPLDELALPALQELDRVLHRLPVVLRRDLVHARGRAAVDLVQDAGPLAVGEDVIGAGAELEPAVHDAEGLADGARARVRAEVARAVLLALARPPHLQPRIGVALVEPQDDEVLVVAQPDVEARLVLLDELVLEEDGLLLRARDDDVDVSQEVVEEGHERPLVAPGRVEIAPYPRPQAGRLADVDHLALPILHEVAARLRRQVGELLSERGVHPPAF